MTFDFKEIVPYLLNWFDYNARILAWRENPKPYYVWISEIMLQQTRVEAVKGYFDRFTAELPDMEALANADEEKLLKLWEGLGYYNRVRNMQRAAQQMIKEYGGELPADYEELMNLPGIGSYTAGAIASIAYKLPVPVVDGNVLRVTKRLSGSFDDITKESVKKELWQDLKEIIPNDRPGDFNQSLMELGACVCLPNGKPLCEKCPIMHLCRAFHEDTIARIPVKPPKKERKKVKRTILLMEYQGRYAIRKREGKGLLAGLWELPGLEGRLEQNEINLFLMDQGITVDGTISLGEAKHIFSHVEWHMIGYYIRVKNLPDQLNNQKLIDLWADKEEIIQKYSIPNAFSAFTQKIRTSSD